MIVVILQQLCSLSFKIIVLNLTSSMKLKLMNLLHGSDSGKLELNRFENEGSGAQMWFDLANFSTDFCFHVVYFGVSLCVLTNKDRELSDVQAKIKAWKLSELLKEKVIEELTVELSKVEGKLKLTVSLLESKVLLGASINLRDE